MHIMQMIDCLDIEDIPLNLVQFRHYKSHSNDETRSSSSIELTTHDWWAKFLDQSIEMLVVDFHEPIGMLCREARRGELRRRWDEATVQYLWEDPVESTHSARIAHRRNVSLTWSECIAEHESMLSSLHSLVETTTSRPIKDIDTQALFYRISPPLAFGRQSTETSNETNRDNAWANDETITLKFSVRIACITCWHKTFNFTEL